MREEGSEVGSRDDMVDLAIWERRSETPKFLVIAAPSKTKQKPFHLVPNFV